MWLDCLRPSYGRTLFERAYHARLASCLNAQGQGRSAGRSTTPAVGASAKPRFPSLEEPEGSQRTSYVDSEPRAQHTYELMRSTCGPGSSESTSPLVVFLHGGAWVASDLRDPAGVHHAFLSDFVGRGWTCVNANYRLSSGAPDDIRLAVQDVGSLLEHLVCNDVAGAGKGGVILMGHSSGAHLALQCALTGLAPEVRRWLRGVVCLGGVYDVADFVRRCSIFVRRFGPRGLSTATPDALRAVSPRYARSETLSCPVRLIHGAGENFLVTQAQECVLSLQARKILASLSVLKQHDHFSLLTPSTLRSDSVVPEICDFMSDCAATRIRTGMPKTSDALRPTSGRVAVESKAVKAQTG